MFFFIMFEIAICILVVIGMWKAFEKAGQPGWACLIPFYNWYIMFKMGGKPGWWLLFIFLGPLFLIWYIWNLNMISKSFGKDEGFTVGLTLLGIIFWPILGFGDAQYKGPYGDPAAWSAANNPKFDFDNQHPTA